MCYQERQDLGGRPCTCCGERARPKQKTVILVGKDKPVRLQTVCKCCQPKHLPTRNPFPSGRRNFGANLWGQRPAARAALRFATNNPLAALVYIDGLCEVLRVQDSELNTDQTALVNSLKARSSDAWTLVYNDHYRLIFRYVFARTSDSGSAEDLASTVFLEALKSIDSYRPRGRPILAWLYRIARNLVSDHYKEARRKQSQPLSSVPESLVSAQPSLASQNSAPLPSHTADPSVDIHWLDLRRAVRSLKEAQREVVVLHYYKLV